VAMKPNHSWNMLFRQSPMPSELIPASFPVPRRLGNMAVVGPAEILDRGATFLASGHSHGVGLTSFFRVPRTELIDSTFPVKSDLPIAAGII
jgi:hypothetical protein